MTEAGRADGRRALVTGGSGEIGSAIARALAEEGADVAIHYYQHRAEAEKVSAEVKRIGRKTAVVQAGLASAKSVNEMRDKLHEVFGKIDTLVNCAGINRDSLFAKMNDEQWEEVIQVNLFGTYHCSKAFVEEIVASGHGRIINISSLVGQMGNVGQVNYAASKSGMIGFTKSLARELACVGTTVNVVAPGFIATPMVSKIPEDVKQKVLSQIPMKRFGTPKEVAMGVIYLISDAADYVTGSVLNLNGGMYL
jgi:3-oxoacyl-(acyl-carrier-protein) reductase